MQRTRRRSRWLAPVSLALAASVAVAIAWWQPWAVDNAPHSEAPAAVALGYEKRKLADGSIAELNHGPAIDVLFTATVQSWLSNGSCRHK